MTKGADIETITADVGIDPTSMPVLRSTRFRREREDGWAALEAIIARYERGGTKSLSRDDLLILPNLYRSALSSLSVARATSLDQSVIAYLESLCTRAYFAIYGAQEGWRTRLKRFFTLDWPDNTRAIWPETLLAGAIFLLGMIVGCALVLADASWYYHFVPDGLAGDRNPASSEAELREVIYGEHGADGLGVFSAFLFRNNAGVAIFSFALGFAFGLPTLILMFYNGLIIGAFLAIHMAKDLGFEIGGWLAIHGTTELFAIVLAGGAGLHIGRATAFPGRRSRLEAAKDHGRRAGVVVIGVVIMLFLAGLIEGYGRQLIRSDALRYGIGGVLLTMWLIYYYLPRRSSAS